MSKNKKKTVSSYQNYLKFYKPCHNPVEITKNLILCSKFQIKEVLEDNKDVNVLIPLDSLEANIWKLLEPGQVEIFYYPVEDYGILESNHLEYLVNKIIEYIKNGKKTCLFCIGGHGRTGYIAACVLGKLGIKDPIEYLWQNYCINSIETSRQVKAIIEFLGNDDLEFYYHQLLENEAQKLAQEMQYFGSFSHMYPYDEEDKSIKKSHEETAEEIANIFINQDYKDFIIE